MAGRVLQGSVVASEQGDVDQVVGAPDERLDVDSRKVRIYAEQAGKIVVLDEDTSLPVLIFFRVYGEKFVDVFTKVVDGVTKGELVTSPFKQSVNAGTLAITATDPDVSWDLWYAQGSWRYMETDTPEL